MMQCSTENVLILACW